MASTHAESVLRVAVPVPLPGLFDYLPPSDGVGLRPGTRVVVPFGQRQAVGVVMAVAGSSDVPSGRLLPVKRALDAGEPLLDGPLLDLLTWCARYYKHAPGEVVMNALPPPLRLARHVVPEAPVQYRLTAEGRERLGQPPGRASAQWQLLDLLREGPADPGAMRRWRGDWSRIASRVVEHGWVAEEARAQPVLDAQAGPELTAEQQSALAALRAGLTGFRCHLLDGITGSGKTEIYLRLIEEVVRSGRQVLVLVPEIGLTPQLVERYRRRLGLQPALSHSGLSDGERVETWAAARRGEARLLIGTRSALFLPLPRPGLIIMDESHDASFKQQEGFRFSARDVAIKRAALLEVPIVLGTATPSLETLHNAASGKYGWIRLRQRATGAPEPAWSLVDLRQQVTQGGLASTTLERIGAALERGEQVLVFLNRRGYAPVLLCHDCGWHGTCQRCDSNMTWHRAGRTLICHHCERRQPVPRVCPDCRADALQGAGAGTEQLERLLGRHFPGFPCYRFDRDQTRRKGAFERLYQEVRRGAPGILVGTQMLAKGHHFEGITLVVIVNLDQALYSADFRAMERMGQLMTQVAGRAGRAGRAGQVVLQTHHPDHPLLARLLRDGYEAFAMELLEERRLTGLPPFTHQAMLRAEAVGREPVLEFLHQARAAFSGDSTGVYGPLPALMERRGGRFRWYLLAQDASRARLQRNLDRWLTKVRSLPGVRRVRWSVDIDPQEA